MILQSSSKVGYAPTALAAEGLGYGVAGGPAFVNVGGGTIDLIDIVVKGYIGYTEGDVVAQLRDPYGGMAKAYAWVDNGDADPGWYRVDDFSYDPLVRGIIPIEAGAGLWLTSGIANMTIQTSGEVPMTANIPTELDQTAQGWGVVVANPTPVEVDLIDCYITGYTGYTEGDAVVQLLDSYGGMDKAYAWVDNGDADPGWYRVDDFSYDPLVKDRIVRGAGAGLWVTTGITSLQFIWPKVTLAK